jgi:hypothetical protein
VGEAIVTLLGRCRERTAANCDRAITTLLTPRAQLGTPDKDEYLPLLGALGGLVGLALAITSGGAG